MVDISARYFLRHLRADPTVHVRHHRRGKLVHDGPAQAFWYLPDTAALAAIPIDDREQPVLCRGRTNDFQEVSVQATVSYRVADPALAAGRIDFGIDPWSGGWPNAPLDRLGELLTELAQQYAMDYLAGLTLAEALAEGAATPRERIGHGLATDPRLADTGIAVVAVRVVAVRAEPEMERALRTPARERVQQEADRATFERRALAVERERAIADNEMQNQIELARRERALVDQRGQNARARATEEAASAGITATSEAERAVLRAESDARRTRLLGEAEAASTKELGLARAESEAARLDAYRDLPAATLLAMAARELAGQLPQVGTLVITPDLVSQTLARLTGPQ